MRWRRRPRRARVRQREERIAVAPDAERGCVDLRVQLGEALHVVEVFALADDIDTAIQADHDHRRTIGDELHALRDVVGTHRMHDEVIARGHRRQGDLLADDVDVHAKAAVEFDGLLGALSLRFGGIRAPIRFYANY